MPDGFKWQIEREAVESGKISYGWSLGFNDSPILWQKYIFGLHLLRRLFRLPKFAQRNLELCIIAQLVILKPRNKPL